MSDHPEIPESLCDCGYQFHELDCAYLDALYAAAVEAGDVVIVPPVSVGGPLDA